MRRRITAIEERETLLHRELDALREEKCGLRKLCTHPITSTQAGVDGTEYTCEACGASW
jgi:hypothetical protein